MGKELLTTDQDRAAYDRALKSYDEQLTPALYEDADPSLVWDLRTSDWTATLLSIGVVCGRLSIPMVISMKALGADEHQITKFLTESAYAHVRTLDTEGVMEQSETVRDYTRFVLTVGIDAAFQQDMEGRYE